MAQIQIMGSVRASHRGVNINRYPSAAPGRQKYPYRQHQEDEEKQRHHDLIGLFYAVGPQKQRKQGAHHYDDVIRHHRIGCAEKEANQAAVSAVIRVPVRESTSAFST